MFEASKFSIWPDVSRPGARSRRAPAATALFGALSLTLAACAAPSSAETDGDAPLRIYATTGYIADAVSRIAPDVEVTTMLGPGGDPHSYQPATRDIERIIESDLVLWHGLHLEAQMVDQLSSLGERQMAVAESVPEELLLALPETDEEGNPLVDPHVWNAPEAWIVVVEAIAGKLGEVDAAGAADYAENAARFTADIEAAAERVESLMATVPEPRLLITGHDAFAYFGATYHLEVRATDFISTEAALSATELSELAELIAAERVPVIFQDNQANPQAITSLREAVRALNWNVEVSREELYADSLGAAPEVDTYLEVFEHNATVIAEAFAGGGA